ncbi:heat-inducible transcriptional repressor HrcA [Fodinisporobacter ferrooxydans]|uniref:Heat-inducible transcription repressor HrcA n=1 Tax=Fodinisporobacter ferrooxydans TaxID=2901836 RepID=A0ABY4CI46_9BACL|nr:heat-inducible transcriptional repressor HrcA [Alicyclobacillaceae bacterium MYW30-H2]
MLTERQKLILRAIIEDYVQSAEPVGSRTLSKHEDIQFSAATIRNEMSDLEELGFLEQPHTSAGRIPSKKGYRFYVDHLLDPFELKSHDIVSMRSLFVKKMDQLEQIVQHTAHILSSLTNYTSIVLGPQIYEHNVRRIDLIPLRDRSAVVIIVTDTGHVENRTVQIPEHVSVDAIEQFVRILNDKLTGVPLYQIRSRMYSEIMQEMQKHLETYEEALAILDQISHPDQEGRVYLGGTTKMLSQPEFRDIEKVKPLFDMFEHTQQVVQILGPPEQLGIQIRIGLENGVEPLQNCSIITSTYSIQGKPAGTIGVLGPTRMDYGRVIRILAELTDVLSTALNRIQT